MLVNLAPGPEGTFTLITASVCMNAPDRPSTPAITGWFTPMSISVESFLEAYSRVGGTHHLAIVYKADLPTLASFAELMGWRHLHIAGE